MTWDILFFNLPQTIKIISGEKYSITFNQYKNKPIIVDYDKIQKEFIFRIIHLDAKMVLGHLNVIRNGPINYFLENHVDYINREEAWFLRAPLNLLEL